MRKFRDWMIKNYGKEVWEKYKKYLKVYCLPFKYCTLKEIEKNIRRDLWVAHAFDWESTNEGFDFWNNIGGEWGYKCRKEELKNEKVS